MSAKQEGWTEKVRNKLSEEMNEGESNIEETRVSRCLFDLFEQCVQVEVSAGVETRETEANTERIEKQEREASGQGKKGESAQSVQDTITFLHELSKSTLPPTLTKETQQQTEWNRLIRRLVSDLREDRITPLRLRNALSEEMNHSGSAEAAKRCLLSLDA